MAEIELSDEQAMLAESARDLLQRRSGFDAVRRAMATEAGFDRELWREIAALGWLGSAVAERHGGAGLGPGSLVPLCEALGRNLTPLPFLATTLAARLMSSAADEDQSAAWLPRLASGEAIGTVAVLEAGTGWDLATPALSASRAGAGYRLEGRKTLVLDAASADVLIVSAALEGQPALFLLERSALPPGALRRQVLVDETRRACSLDLRGVELSADARLGRRGETGVIGALRDLSQFGALLVAAEMAGGTGGVIDLTVEYLRTRTQFGKPIGGYQALKHPMVDILVAYEQSRSLLYHAATVADREPARLALPVHMAKAHCGQTFTHAADRAIQFHGAIGFTHECHAQLFFRRAQWAEYTFGDARHHRRRLESLLLDAAW